MLGREVQESEGRAQHGGGNEEMAALHASSRQNSACSVRSKSRWGLG
jgi:hypothetical protein